MKKYKSVVSQLSVDQITLSEQTQQIAELEHEKQVRTITYHVKITNQSDGIDKLR